MRTLPVGLAVLALTLLAGCGDYGAPNEVVFGTAVYTQPRPGFDFTTVNTYFLDPTYNVADDSTKPGSPGTPQPLPSSVIQTIDTNMQNLGWTPAAMATAQVGLHVSVLKGTGAVYYPGYWCDYWVYYGCYYDWYYAGSYKFGTVILQMGDLKNSTPGQQLQVLWVGTIYGVSQNNVAADSQRIIDGLNRAFAQSPFLKTTSP